MKLFKHVFYTWSLAIAITLTGLFVYDIVVHLPNLPTDLFRFQLVITAFGAFAVSIPSLLIGLLFFQFIYSSYYTITEKFSLWCIAAISAIIINILFISFVFAPDMFEINLILILWPSYAGLLVSISLRYKYFYLLFNGSVLDKVAEKNPEAKI